MIDTKGEYTKKLYSYVIDFRHISDNSRALGDVLNENDLILKKFDDDKFIKTELAEYENKLNDIIQKLKPGDMRGMFLHTTPLLITTYILCLPTSTNLISDRRIPRPDINLNLQSNVFDGLFSDLSITINAPDIHTVKPIGYLRVLHRCCKFDNIVVWTILLSPYDAERIETCNRCNGVKLGTRFMQEMWGFSTKHTCYCSILHIPMSMKKTMRWNTIFTPEWGYDINNTTIDINTTKRLYGVELELYDFSQAGELRGSLAKVEQFLRSPLKYSIDGKHIAHSWVHDGTITYGAELILAPATLERLSQDTQIAAMFDLLQDIERESRLDKELHEEQLLSCSMHVHVNKESITVDQLKNAINFVITYPELTIQLGLRDSYSGHLKQYMDARLQAYDDGEMTTASTQELMPDKTAKWNPPVSKFKNVQGLYEVYQGDCNRTGKSTLHHSLPTIHHKLSKYAAINLRNHKTIEFRFFRLPRTHSEFIGNIAIVNMLLSSTPTSPRELLNMRRNFGGTLVRKNRVRY